MDLQNAAALVTGGASGIGEACTAQLQAAGARVGVLDLQDASGGDVHVRTNVADEKQVVDAVDRVARELGGLNVVVLSAGVGGSAPLREMATAEWDRVMNVNLRGAFICLRECARAMTDGGVIIAITSVSGALHERTMAHYGASKAALAHLVQSAARELGPLGIRVNAVAPGITDTPMFAPTEHLPGYRERVGQRAALGRIGTADEVAQAVVALCGLDWVTGQVLAADGGVSLYSPIDPRGDA